MTAPTDAAAEPQDGLLVDMSEGERIAIAHGLRKADEQYPPDVPDHKPFVDMTQAEWESYHAKKDGRKPMAERTVADDLMVSADEFAAYQGAAGRKLNPVMQTDAFADDAGLKPIKVLWICQHLAVLRRAFGEDAAARRAAQ
jgi:hypothetical protein